MDLLIKFEEVLAQLEREGVTEIPVGSLATRLANHLPGPRPDQTAFHCIHRFGHKAKKWILIRNKRHVQVMKLKA